MLDAENGFAAPASGEAVNPEAAQTNAAPTQAQTGSADGGNDSQAQEKTFTQKELDEILQKRIAKAEARAERRVLRTLERVIPQPQQSAQPAQQAQSQDGKPSRAHYASDEAYVDALTDWKLEQRDREAAEKRQQEQQRTLAQKTESIYAEAEKLDGFDREAFDELPLTKPMVEALIDSDAAAKLMHYMAANPEEVERIATLSPARQAAELGKMEAKATAAPIKPSKAPQPITPVGSRSSSTASALPSDADDIDTWMRKERARLRKG